MEKRGYTLITSLGTGMFNRQSGYRETTYRFPNGVSCNKTPLFLRAILETGYWPVRKVVLIGTRTSSWDVLIPDRDGENGDFWLAARERCEAGGIDDALIRELEEKLPGWYGGIPFALEVHTPEISAANVEAVFAVYNRVCDEIAPDTDILFDITHGFRSMPVLIYQSLQLNIARLTRLAPRRVCLVYGEYNEREKVSQVRDLSQYWDYYEISAAKNLFEEKLDGRLLANKVEPYWAAGAAGIRRFSEVVECNFSLQLPEALRQMRNALEKFDGAPAPPWAAAVRDDVAKTVNALTVSGGEKYPTAKTLLKYARLLESKRLIVQAIIALQVTVETAVAEKFAPDKVGDYEWFHGSAAVEKSAGGDGRRYLKKIKNDDGRVKDLLNKIETLRNQIAHGGGKDRFSGAFPSMTSLPRILKSSDAIMGKFFGILDDMPDEEGA